ncbi:MFS general substrate transporter [Hysterangium stoloniferum]|nr:MFS general substrate transporter [Hysterangium stoloniferum]
MYIHRNECCCRLWRASSTAGGLFTFPLISESSDIGRFRLTQPQVSSIVLAGMIGQYPVAPLVGMAIDRVGPWACSLTSAFLFATGFGLFSLEFRNAQNIPTQAPSSWAFYRLFLFYFLVGLGTVTSYFSSLFSASKNFPRNSGLAAGTTMALFGLSPLILSIFASAWFTRPQGGLNVGSYTAFLAILTGVIHIIGAINLRVEPPLEDTFTDSTFNAHTHNQDDSEDPPETMPLLSRPVAVKTYGRIWDVLRDYDFWILAATTLLAIGSCEMVIANIGTIAMTLPAQKSVSRIPTAFNTLSGTSAVTTQVQLLSLFNTLSRIITGPMADFISPVASYLPSGLLMLPPQHKISRVVFLFGAIALMVLSFLWMIFGVTNQQQIWIFSVGIGIAYGSIFTVLPSLVASIWGTATLARNFGLITYSPFIGTSIFSYLYAFVASAAVETQDKDGYSAGACVGKRCWRLTFIICAASGLVATSLSGALWKRWRGRL